MKLHRIFLVVLFLSLVVITGNAIAGSGCRLNKQSIEDFINKTTEITAHSSDLSSKEIQDFLEKHLHKDGLFRSEIRYTIPGFPSQINTLSLDKRQFIEGVLSGYESLNEYDVDVDVKKVKISRDGKKANITTYSKEKGEMPVPDGNGRKEMIPVDGHSTCDQVIVLEDGGIQMYSADCTTEISFAMPF